MYTPYVVYQLSFEKMNSLPCSVLRAVERRRFLILSEGLTGIRKANCPFLVARRKNSAIQTGMHTETTELALCSRHITLFRIKMCFQTSSLPLRYLAFRKLNGSAARLKRLSVSGLVISSRKGRTNYQAVKCSAWLLPAPSSTIRKLFLPTSQQAPLTLKTA